MNILLIRLRLVGDVVFTTPAIRALRRRFPGARITYLVERAAAPIVARQSAPRRGDRRRAHARSAPAPRRCAARADAAGQALRPRDRFPRRPAQLVADVGDRRAAADRLHDRRPRLDVHRPRAIARASCGRATRSRTSGICSRRSASRRSTPPTDPVEMAETPDARRRVDATLAAAGVTADAELIVIHVSAGNPFRRWPADAFADAGRRARAQLAAAPHPAHVGSVGEPTRRPRSPEPRARRSGQRPPGASC